MNSATASTSGASASRMRPRFLGCRRRGLPSAKTKPTASTPSSLARRTSPARVRPQNLMRVRNSVRAHSGHLGGQAAQAAGYTGPRNTSPAAGAVGPATVRSRPASNSAIQASGCSPRPTSSRRADDIAHHVVQEGIRLHLDHDLIAAALDRDRLQVAPRMRRLAVHGAERAEVVLADQRLRGGVHRVGVERQALPAQVLAAQRRAHRAVEDAIAVAARARGKARVEIVGHRHAPAHAHRRRQARGGAEHPAARIALRRRCRNARPGRPHARRHRCGRRRSVSTCAFGDERQRRFQRLLHGCHRRRRPAC